MGYCSGAGRCVQSWGLSELRQEPTDIEHQPDVLYQQTGRGQFIFDRMAMC